MQNFLLGIGVILVVVVLLMLVRTQSLVSVFLGTNRKRVTVGNRVNAIFLLFFLIIGLGLTVYYSIKYFDLYNLPLASAHGAKTDFLFWTTMVITGIVFVITQVLLFVFSYKYQFNEKKKATFYPENNRLELAWTIVPAIALSILIFSGWKVWSEITEKAPQDAEVIEIMGYQFAWGVRYPGADGKLGKYDFRLIDATNVHGMDFSDENTFDDFIPSKLVLPKGKPVLLKIRARDVLHSVFAPHFRLKMDAVPGMPTQFWFIPTKSTEDMRRELSNPNFNYEIACTEICGRSHFSMKLAVEVLEEEEYNEWYMQQETWTVQNEEYMQEISGRLKSQALNIKK